MSADGMTRDGGRRKRRTCFVTIGATASFEGLIQAVLAPDFLKALDRHEYTELIVQFGAGGEELFESCCSRARRALEPPLTMRIDGFPVDTGGLDRYMRRAKAANDEDAMEGCIISHAGTGTILAAMRLAIAVIVVPNEELLDNHQVELAEVLDQQGYVVHGRIDDLIEALHKSEKVRQGLHSHPPVNSGEHRKSNTIKRVLDEEMGFLD